MTEIFRYIATEKDRADILARCKEWPASAVDAAVRTPVSDMLRISLSVQANGCVEISSLETQTTLLLPALDVELLTEGLRTLDRIGSTRETLDLDPSL